MMTRNEFKQIAEDVFAEMLPKVKAGDRDEFMTMLINELVGNGLELEGDEDSDDETYED